MEETFSAHYVWVIRVDLFLFIYTQPHTLIKNNISTMLQLKQWISLAQNRYDRNRNCSQVVKENDLRVGKDFHIGVSKDK